MRPFSVIFVFSLAGVIAAKNETYNSIAFPEVEEDPNLKNKDNRQPVYLPSTCPVNELLYPGDQKDDWICDCRPSHLYHPGSDTCWPAFQRGPCAFDEYLILPPNSVIPICEKNPCSQENYVLFNGKCERLGSISACSFMYPIVAAVEVNASNLLVECVRLNLETRFAEKPSEPCHPGSKLSVNHKCDKTK